MISVSFQDVHAVREGLHVFEVGIENVHEVLESGLLVLEEFGELVHVGGGEGVRVGGRGGGGGEVASVRGVLLLAKELLLHANARREFVETAAVFVGFGELEEEVV